MVLDASEAFSNSQENKPNPAENRNAEANEDAQGPILSMRLPTNGETGYCPTSPLKERQSQETYTPYYTTGTHASAMEDI